MWWVATIALVFIAYWFGKWNGWDEGYWLRPDRKEYVNYEWEDYKRCKIEMDGSQDVARAVAEYIRTKLLVGVDATEAKALSAVVASCELHYKSGNSLRESFN